MGLLEHLRQVDDFAGARDAPGIGGITVATDEMNATSVAQAVVARAGWASV